jgi:hypothetical protein
MDLIRAAVQLVMRDKIVAGLVIVAILGMFYCGVNQTKDAGGHRFAAKQAKEGGQEDNGSEAMDAGDKGQSEGQEQGQGQAKGPGQGKDGGQTAATQAAGNAAQQPAAPAQPAASAVKLEPKLAMDFVRWWLTLALDYSVSSPGNHKKAMDYAKPSVAKQFSKSFYTPEVMQGVANGTLAGAFEPVTVQAIAINPDGSVVVTVIGTLSMQSSGSQPVSQSLVLEFLVEKDPEGVHMAGFFNKTISQAPAAQAAPQEAAPSGPPQFEGQ